MMIHILKDDTITHIPVRLLKYVSHKYNCGNLQPMWHKSSCDCGLYALFDDLWKTAKLADGISTACLNALYTTHIEQPELIKDWIESCKSKLPDRLFICKKCTYPLAEKQDDIQGWDGYCNHCGMIAQNQVGDLVFSK